MAGLTSVNQLYRGVMDDVVTNAREAFLDEGVDEQVLLQLRELWECKLIESRAITNDEFGVSVPVPRNVSDVSGGTISAYDPFAEARQQHALRQNQSTFTSSTYDGLSYNQGKDNSAMSGAAAAATNALPAHIADLLQSRHHGQDMSSHQGQMQTNLSTADESLQRHYPIQHYNRPSDVMLPQFDGPGIIDSSDSSSDDDEAVDDDDDDLDDDPDNLNEGEEEEPLNSDDDVTDEDASELFDTENVVVCQYDKITRSRNKWKFHLKDGIMNVEGRDYVFQKANGDAEW